MISNVHRIVGAGFAVLAVTTMSATAAHATPGDANGAGGHQVWVCKYVEEPGVGEVLKAGKQPIAVDVASIDTDSVPVEAGPFSDRHIQSSVIGVVVDGEPAPSAADCVPPDSQ